MEAYKLRFRRGSAVQWLAANPVLGPGEPGYEFDTGVYKIGDGYTRWSSLPGYLDRDEVIRLIDNAGVPDEGPSLVLLYENAKV